MLSVFKFKVESHTTAIVDSVKYLLKALVFWKFVQISNGIHTKSILFIYLLIFLFV